MGCSVLQLALQSENLSDEESLQLAGTFTDLLSLSDVASTESRASLRATRPSRGALRLWFQVPSSRPSDERIHVDRTPGLQPGARSAITASPSFWGLGTPHWIIYKVAHSHVHIHIPDYAFVNSCRTLKLSVNEPVSGTCVSPMTRKRIYKTAPLSTKFQKAISVNWEFS